MNEKPMFEILFTFIETKHFTMRHIMGVLLKKFYDIIGDYSS